MSVMMEKNGVLFLMRELDIFKGGRVRKDFQKKMLFEFRVEI